jgi:hypothetical protein
MISIEILSSCYVPLDEEAFWCLFGFLERVCAAYWGYVQVLENNIAAWRVAWCVSK